MNNLETIHNYLLIEGYEEESLKSMDDSTVNLALKIALFAHKDQKRVNGEDYINHPLGLMLSYRELVGIKPDDYYSVDVDLLEHFDIPFHGVQEVCLLHDVIEDTSFTMEEIKEIYKEQGFEQYFTLYIEEALSLITHDKSENYDVYVLKCMQNRTASLVKLLDLNDNSNVLTLNKLSKRRYERTVNYLKNIKHINDRYHFIENINLFKKMKSQTKKK